MTIFSRISKRAALSSSDQSDKSDAGPTASPRSSVPSDSMRESTASEPPIPAKDLRSRSSLGDSEFTEQAVRVALKCGADGSLPSAAAGAGRLSASAALQHDSCVE